MKNKILLIYIMSNNINVSLTTDEIIDYITREESTIAEYIYPPETPCCIRNYCFYNENPLNENKEKEKK